MQLEVAVEPLTSEISGQVRMPLLVLFGAVALVLMVACANVANLVLSRAAVRQRELGVRQALGARRLRLAQLLLAEALLLSVAGGVLGLGFAQGLLRAVPATLAESLPGLQNASLDVRLVLFTTVTAVGTALIFGLLPLYISDRDVAGRLHEGSGRTAGGGRAERVQRVLVSATVSLAFVLLVGAGLLVRSFNALVATEPGFAPHRVLSLSLDLPREGYPTGQSVATLVRTAFERSQSVPGVEAATISTDLPLESNERRALTPDTRVPIEGLPAVAVTWVYGDYFRTLGIPMRQGRPFTSTEDQAPGGVIILSESLAARCFRGEDAIGKRVKWGIRESKSPWMTVVGVAGDVKDGSLRDDPTVHVYVPLSLLPDELDRLPPNSSFGRSIRIALLARGDPSALVGSSRVLVSALDRSLPITRVATMQQQIDASVAPNRFSTVVLTAFAAAALLLAAIGLYGVLAFAITQRTREIGVRMALGASRTSVLTLVVGQGMRLVLIGLAVGLAAALALTRVMTSLLYRTQPYDVWTFVLTAAVLSAVAALACYLPARRAAAVEPMKALRTE
jgi:predicted permease